MIQKKFLCKDITAANEVLGEIDRIISETKHKCALISIYEKGVSRQEMESFVGSIKKLGHKELQIAGISLTLVAELMPEGSGLLLNLILTEEADIDVVSVPCAPGEEIEAAAKLRSRLDATDDVKVVELFGSNMALNTTAFMEKAMEGHEDAVLFGTTTIKNLMQKVSVAGNDNSVEVEKIDPGMAGDELIIGNDVLYDGFVAVVFSGKKLNILADYALGWNPVGRRLTVELGDESPMGETVVKTINGLPAVDIYTSQRNVSLL